MLKRGLLPENGSEFLDELWVYGYISCLDELVSYAYIM